MVEEFQEKKHLLKEVKKEWLQGLYLGSIATAIILIYYYLFLK